MMKPSAYYQKQVNLGLVAEDAEQVALIASLDRVHSSLIHEDSKRRSLVRFIRRPKAERGIYIWGGVGIGKTLVMDCFYHALPMQNKMRVHFHEFMRDIHSMLKLQQGEKNPLHAVADQLASQCIVLCLDELIVTDIADAMILRRLLEALIERGVCLVVTSNTMPDELYKNGLQRISFLPAIKLIKTALDIYHLASSVDYRRRHLQQSGVYHVPADDIAEDDLEKCFSLLTEGHLVTTDKMTICERQVIIRKAAHDCIWFDFNRICMPPRSQHDYLEIAQHFKTVIISNIPVIDAEQNDVILLFIRMVDVFYDAKIRLICSAATSPDSLYIMGRMLPDYQRTQSRLIEMQSESYFGL